MPTINVEPGFDQKLQEIADILAKSRKVVVITGAGISTNCGIPDFRSENGLYSLIQAQYEAVAGITPFSDGIDNRPVKRRRVDCVATSIPTKTTEDRFDPQLPNRHSHSSRINSTNLPMEENIVQPIFEPPLKPKFDKKTFPAEAQEPSTRRQLRSYSLVAKDVTTLPPCGGFVKETPPKSTSIPPKETNVLQRKFCALKSVQSTDIATDLRTNPSNKRALSLKRAPAVVPKASDHPRRLRSSRSLEKPDATLKPDPVSLVRKPSTRTLQRREEKVSILRRSLRSSVTSDLKKASLSLENCIKEKSNPTKESTSMLEEDTSCIEVTLPQSSPKLPLQSDLEADSHIHVDIDEPLLLQTSSVSASTRGLPNLKGKDLFDAIIWTNPLTTSIFYTFVSNLRQKILSGIKETTPTHKFIRVLRDGGRLVRNYTQNIDLLEAREGLCTDLERGPGSRARFTSKNQKEAQPTTIPGGGPHDRGVEVVHLHGKLDGLRCGLCARYANWDEDNRHRATLAGEAPECPWCKETSAHREGRGRRSLSVGRLRPDIVLYGEEHPSAHLVGPIVTHDLSLGPDVLLILGTSLRVHGLKFMVKEFAKAVHGKGGKVIFINKSKPPESIWAEVIDYWVEWDCDAWVGDLQERRKDIWLPQGTPSKGPLQEEKEKPIPKNPTATRVDVTNGAHHTLKIMERLGRLSGRLPEFGKSLNRHQELTYKTTTEDESKERKRPLTPRQASVRLNKENGAYLVFEIITNLRRLSGNPQTTGKMKPVRAPLASTSANLPSKRLRTRQASPTREKFSPYYLPTPPNSDQAMPHMTRETDILSG